MGVRGKSLRFHAFANKLIACLAGNEHVGSHRRQREHGRCLGARVSSAVFSLVVVMLIVILGKLLNIQAFMPPSMMLSVDKLPGAAFLNEYGIARQHRQISLLCCCRAGPPAGHTRSHGRHRVKMSARASISGACPSNPLFSDRHISRLLRPWGHCQSKHHRLHRASRRHRASHQAYRRAYRRAYRQQRRQLADTSA
jgi:hypothetical protein